MRRADLPPCPDCSGSGWHPTEAMPGRGCPRCMGRCVLPVLAPEGLTTCDRCASPASAPERGNGRANWCPGCEAEHGPRAVAAQAFEEVVDALGRDGWTQGQHEPWTLFLTRTDGSWLKVRVALHGGAVVVLTCDTPSKEDARRGSPPCTGRFPDDVDLALAWIAGRLERKPVAVPGW